MKFTEDEEKKLNCILLYLHTFRWLIKATNFISRTYFHSECPVDFLLRKFYQATFSTESQLILGSLQVLLSVFPDTVRALTVGILTLMLWIGFLSNVEQEMKILSRRTVHEPFSKFNQCHSFMYTFFKGGIECHKWFLQHFYPLNFTYQYCPIPLRHFLKFPDCLLFCRAPEHIRAGLHEIGWLTAAFLAKLRL